MNTPIPLVDLVLQHEQVREEVTAGIADVMARGGFIGGAEVGEFESAYADHVGARHVIGVANGTDALELALRGAGARRGDEVIVPANTFIATAEAVVRAGLDVRLVDCEAEHGLIDVDQALDAIGDRTAAIMPVDLYGQVAPIEAFEGISPLVVEDAAQSQGATRHGRGAGTFGNAAGTSFYPGKNLGAYGDAGAVVTDDAAIAADVRALGAHGGTKKYEHRLVGVNSRLDTIQAVVLRAKLRRLPEWNEQRRVAADRYAELLADVEPVTQPGVLDGNVPVWHLYVVQVDDRDEVLRTLQENGIGAGIHYPDPVHRTGAFGHLGHGPGSFPVAERLAARILSLPLYPGITEAQQERVAEVLRKAVGA